MDKAQFAKVKASVDALEHCSEDALAFRLGALVAATNDIIMSRNLGVAVGIVVDELRPRRHSACISELHAVVKQADMATA